MLTFFHLFFFFFFNDTATTEIYTLSLHDALPILARPTTARSSPCWSGCEPRNTPATCSPSETRTAHSPASRSEEHTSELQSQFHLVCRLLLEKKKKKNIKHSDITLIMLIHTTHLL